VCRIGDFIACDKPEAAARWVQRILETVERLGPFPNSGRTVPEIGCDDVREIIFDGYRIVYQIHQDTITILTVFEGRLRLSERISDGESS
jgi:plasmid stabilization system protein ParE